MPRKPPSIEKLKAVGLTCGIGSMLVGARMGGFEVLGNIEWRKYYHKKDKDGKNTFLENFPGAFFVHSIEEAPALPTIDVAFGHPECGNFSQLDGMNSNRGDDPGDIPLFVDLVARVKPRFFVMDDLPKSFIAFSMEKYASLLPEYDLFPEWVSNFHYGNVQRFRKRFFLIGALKKEKFAFRPGEYDNKETVQTLIGDLPDPQKKGSHSIPNHDPHVLDGRCDRAMHFSKRGEKATWREVQKFFKDGRPGTVLPYQTADGSYKKRIGTYRNHWDGHAAVLTGGAPAIHGERCLPYTIRERARIQGFPDDFIFYGTILNEKGEWNHTKDATIVKQTGKAMPVQFNAYIAKQIAAHINGVKFESSGHRFLPPDRYVDDAKQWYCENVGYSNQPKACEECTMLFRCHLPMRVEPEDLTRWDNAIDPTYKPPKPKKERRPKVERAAVSVAEFQSIPKRGRGRPRKVPLETPPVPAEPKKPQPKPRDVKPAPIVPSVPSGKVLSNF